MWCGRRPLLKVPLTLVAGMLHHLIVWENTVKGKCLTLCVCSHGLRRAAVSLVHTVMRAACSLSLLQLTTLLSRHAPFPVSVKHGFYPDNRLLWSQSKSEPACKPRSPDLPPKLLLLLPLCPLSLPKSCHFFLFPPLHD